MQKLNTAYFKKFFDEKTKKRVLSPPPQFVVNYMKVIAVASQVPSLLQIIKTISRQSAGDISLAGLAVGFFCVTSWLIYSLMIRDKPLILSNILGFLLNGANLAVTLIYR